MQGKKPTDPSTGTSDPGDECDSGCSGEPTITICRDIPGPHTGGPGCFCCPGTFRISDDAGIDDFLANQGRMN